MSFKFESKNQSIGETLFGINSLRVPQFQRPYTWEEDQCNDFWSDLVDDDSFFLGQFIFNHENLQQEKFIDIVDGQQRTTSILILCAVFRDKATELGAVDEVRVIQHTAMLAALNFSGPKYKVLVSPTMVSFFENHIQNEGNPITKDTPYDKDNEEEKRVVKNYLYFRSQLEDLIKGMSPSEQIDEIKRIFEFLKSAQIIATKIYDENDAYEIFESVNNTGVDLGVADLVKNFLFKKIKIEEGGSTNDVMDKWNEIIENVPNSELTKFIRYYWLSKHGAFVTEAKLFKAIKNHSVPSWKDFLQELLDNARIYYDLRNPFDADFSSIDGAEKVKNALIGIKEMNITQSYVLLLCIYRNKEKIRTNWVRIFELIEKFNFLYHATSKLPANKVEKLYQAWAAKIEYLVSTEKDESVLRVSLETEFNGISSKLKSLVPSKEIFTPGFIDLGYKKKGLCRYILSKIEESKSRAREYVLNQPTITLEHILPQKPGKDWNLTQAQIKSYVHNIGNLTLLGKKPNGTVQNKSIAEKIKILKTSTDIKITQELLEEIDNDGIWNEVSIRNRAMKLADIAYDKVWNIT